MAARFATCSLKRAAGLLVILLSLVAGAMVGCSTPQERYKVLSVFFDGVPDPSKPKVARHVASDLDKEVVVKAVVMTRHKPYVDNQCSACHTSDTGNIMEFDEAYKRCVRCHKKVSTEHPLMHGPVAREACQWCHTGHESPQPALLKDEPIKVCTQCHDQQLLDNKPPEHTDGKTSCLLCHAGHGGSQRYFFKPVPQTQPVEWPGTSPGGTPDMQSGKEGATQPARQPSSGPDTAPSRPPPLQLGGGV